MVGTQDLSYCCIPKTTAHVNSLMELLEVRAGLGDGRPAYTFLADGEAEGQVITYKMLDQQARAVYSKIVAVPAYPPHRNRNLLRLQAIIRDAKPKLLLTTSALLPKLKKAMAESEETASIQIIATDEAGANETSRYKRPSVDRETIAFLNTRRVFHW